MMLFQTLFVLSVPLMGLTIFVIKKRNVLTSQLKELNRYQQFAVLGILIGAVAIGGTKVTPGPTKANLKILLAEREAKKLSSGEAYGDKEKYREGLAFTDSATASVSIVESSLPAISNVVSVSAPEVSAAISEERHYLRWVFPRPALNEMSNLYGETMRVTVEGGIATAYVWFNVVPNAEPHVCFTFATETVENRLETVFPMGSSFPDTTSVNGYECFTYTFSIPSSLLSDGELIAPLDFEKQIALGCPEQNKPFNVAGGIALYWNDQYWVGVTGWRTNSVDGIAYYYSNGLLADPPANKASTEVPSEEF